MQEHHASLESLESLTHSLNHSLMAPTVSFQLFLPSESKVSQSRHHKWHPQRGLGRHPKHSPTDHDSPEIKPSVALDSEKSLGSQCGTADCTAGGLAGGWFSVWFSCSSMQRMRLASLSKATASSSILHYQQNHGQALSPIHLCKESYYEAPKFLAGLINCLKVQGIVLGGGPILLQGLGSPFQLHR